MAWTSLRSCPRREQTLSFSGSFNGLSLCDRVSSGTDVIPRHPDGNKGLQGHDDQWQEVGCHITGVTDCLEGLKLHPEIVYCCVLHDGVYRTSDAGANWERIFEGDARAAAVNPSDDRIVYVGTEPVRLYRSEDQGNTWEELDHLLDLPDEVRRHWKSPQPQYQGHVRHIFIARGRSGDGVNRRRVTDLSGRRLGGDCE